MVAMALLSVCLPLHAEGGLPGAPKTVVEAAAQSPAPAGATPAAAPEPGSAVFSPFSASAPSPADAAPESDDLDGGTAKALWAAVFALGALWIVRWSWRA